MNHPPPNFLYRFPEDAPEYVDDDAADADSHTDAGDAGVDVEILLHRNASPNTASEAEAWTRQAQGERIPGAQIRSCSHRSSQRLRVQLKGTQATAEIG